MRLLLLALMITLLPLRGWVGDVMAMEQVAQAHPAAQDPAVHSDCHETQARRGDAVHADPAAAGDDGSAHADGDCAGCTACQICHSVALAGMPSVSCTAPLPAAIPHTPVRLHASAERIPGFKPPIS